MVTTASEQRLTVVVSGLPGGACVAVSYSLPGNEPFLRVEVEPYPSASTSEVTEVRYPGPLVPLNDTPRHTVWPNSNGTLIPHAYSRAIGVGEGERSMHMSLGRGLYQPWWGLVTGRSGYAAIAETPFDFALDLRHPSGGPTRTASVWVASLGRLAYPRAIRYTFCDGADHTKLAKIYRAYAQSVGRWISLADKFARNPQSKRLVGAMIFPVTVSFRDKQRVPMRVSLTTYDKLTRQLNKLPALGIERAYFHVDGWGFHGYDSHHPDVLPPCPEAGGWEGLIRYSQAAQKAGYLFGLHDQYRDYYLDGPAFSESKVIRYRDGSYPQWSYWAGGPQSVICAKEAYQYVRRTFTELLSRGVVLTGSYLDVFAVVDMDECFNPLHPMTREDCYRERARMLDYVRSLGIAISSEEPVDHFMPHLEFCHWADVPRVGFMRGEPLGVPVPLHNLVYHDSLLLPSVWDYGYDPELRRENYIRGIAQVEMPYAHADWTSAEQFAPAHAMANLHRAWGTHELVAHRLLDDAGSMQEFIYPEGSVTIDLAAMRYRIEGGKQATDGWVDAPSEPARSLHKG